MLGMKLSHVELQLATKPPKLTNGPDIGFVIDRRQLFSRQNLVISALTEKLARSSCPKIAINAQILDGLDPVNQKALAQP